MIRRLLTLSLVALFAAPAATALDKEGRRPVRSTGNPGPTPALPLPLKKEPAAPEPPPRAVDARLAREQRFLSRFRSANQFVQSSRTAVGRGTARPSMTGGVGPGERGPRSGRSRSGRGMRATGGGGRCRGY